MEENIVYVCDRRKCHKCKETRLLEEKIKKLSAEKNQIMNLLAHYLLKAYEDKPELLSVELKEMVKKYAEDTEIERLLKK